MSERLRLLYDLSVKYEVPGISTYDRFLQSLKDNPQITELLYRQLSGKHNASIGATFESFSTQIQPDIDSLPDVIENVPPFHKSPPLQVPGVFDTQVAEPLTTVTKPGISPEATDTTQPPVTQIDPFNTVFDVLKRFEQGTRATTHNNPGAVIWTSELAQMFNAEKGESFQDEEGRTLYTARFINPQVGEKASKYIAQKIWNWSNQDPTKFYAEYSGKDVAGDTVKNFTFEVNRQVPITPTQQPVPASSVISGTYQPPPQVSPAAGLPIPRSLPTSIKKYKLEQFDPELQEPLASVFEGFGETYKRFRHQDELGKQLQESLYKGDIDWKEHRELWEQNKYSYEEIAEPLMTALAPVETKGVVETAITAPVNITKELATLAVIGPHITASIMDDVATGNYTRTAKGIADFYTEVYSNWITAVNPDFGTRQVRKQKAEAWRKIANQPLFHVLGLALPVGLWQRGAIKTEAPPPPNVMGVKVMPRNLEKFVAETKAKEIVDFIEGHPDTATKIITKTSEQIKEGNLPEIEVFTIMPKDPREAAKPRNQEAHFDAVTQLPSNLKDVKTPGAERMEIQMDLADIEASSMRKTSFQKVKEKMVTMTVDVAGNVKKQLLDNAGDIGKRAVIYKDTMAGTSARAAHLYKGYSDRIYGGLNKKEQKMLDRIIRARRVIAIEGYKPEYNPGAGVIRGDAARYLDYVPKNIHDKLDIRAETYFEIMRSELGRLVKEEVITPQSYEQLLKYEYEPTVWLDKINPEITYKIGGETVSLRESGIKNLKEGMESLPTMDSQLLLGRVVAITDARISRNKANRALYDVANKVPDNGIVLKGEPIFQGSPTYKPPPPGYTNMPVRIGGEVKEFYMRNDMAREWIAQGGRPQTENANIAGWFLGANILRPMATGYNPEFALTNLPRDIAHIFLTTKEYSSFAPKFLGEIGKDLGAVAIDTFKRKGRYADYILEGGGMNFMTHQGRSFAFTGPLESLGKALGYFGESAELWTRLALRERALRNGKSNIEATWIARNYLDFSQGGSMIKAVDVGVPYLNAATQGTRGIVRAAKNDPGLFSWKVSQVGALSTGLYLANRHVNEEAYNSISTRDKVANWIITTPMYEIDDEGNKRYYYLRIPKDQGQRVFATGFESLMARYLDKEQPPEELYEMMSMAARDFSPVDIKSLPPTVDAIFGYMLNKDFWREEDIWKGPDLAKGDRGLEFTPDTHPFFVDIGEKMPIISPMRLQYSLQQYATYGNIYTDVAGAGYKMLFDELPEDEQDKTMKMLVADAPFGRKYWKRTPRPSVYREVEKIRKDTNAINLQQNRGLTEIVTQHFNGMATRSAVNDYIRQFDRPTQDRLRNRFKREEKFKDIPNRRFWVSLTTPGLTPEAAAQVYYAEWVKLDDVQKQEYEQVRLRILHSKRFNRHFNDLKLARQP